jgi:hypothetical protein
VLKRFADRRDLKDGHEQSLKAFGGGRVDGGDLLLRERRELQLELKLTEPAETHHSTYLPAFLPTFFNVFGANVSHTFSKFLNEDLYYFATIFDVSQSEIGGPDIVNDNVCDEFDGVRSEALDRPLKGADFVFVGVGLKEPLTDDRIHAAVQLLGRDLAEVI